MMKEKLASECTSMTAGAAMTKDGSLIFARSADYDATVACNFEMHDDTENGPGEFVAADSPFRCPLPRKALGHFALPDTGFPGGWGACGFNSAGVGMSATESIFSSDRALSFDPYVESGVGENTVYNVVIPFIRSAREGVERLGSLIEKYGSAEGFGVGFLDNKEIWYLENACGHHWLARRIPDESYFVTGNQSRLRRYDPADTGNFLASPGLVEFAYANALLEEGEEFDFHKAYSRDEESDHSYNYPRVWGLQKMFSPSIKSDVRRNTFPVFAKSEELLGVDDFRRAFRFHYQDSEHDPYPYLNGHEAYRPVSIFRTQQTHILQIRPWLPKEIGCLNHLCLGMADLGVFLPLYQGVKSFPEAYMTGGTMADDKSAYWKFRKLSTLVMLDYNNFSPVVKDAFSAFENELDRRRVSMEEEYLRLAPAEAAALLQSFSDGVLLEALDLASDLTNELFTRLTLSVQSRYQFCGA